MKPQPPRGAWPPPEALRFPADLIQPPQDETHLAFFRSTPRPFVFLHSSHLPPGIVTEQHSHPCVALHGCLQGPLTLATAREEVTFDAGVFFLLEPGVRHYWRNPGGRVAAHISVLIDHRNLGSWPASAGVKDMCRELLRRVHGLRRFNVAGDAELRSAFWPLADYLMADRPRLQAAATGLLLALLGRAVELMDEPTAPATPAAPGDVAEEMRRFLLARISERVSVEEVAQAVHLSTTRAKELFRQTHGCGIMAYFNQLKIWQAKRLLGGSALTIDQVSRKLGFSSPSYFTRVFQRYTGEAPTDFRQQRAGQ
jgi:AraC-like DNA-binding protein/quercetin dioxygenase-like cupin family protein